MFVSLKDLLPPKIDQSYVMSVIEGGGWVASASMHVCTLRMIKIASESERGVPPAEMHYGSR